MQPFATARQPVAESPDATPLENAEVDETLLAMMLALTPEERLRLNDRQAELALRLRDAFASAEVRCR